MESCLVSTDDGIETSMYSMKIIQDWNMMVNPFKSIHVNKEKGRISLCTMSDQSYLQMNRHFFNWCPASHVWTVWTNYSDVLFIRVFTVHYFTSNWCLYLNTFSTNCRLILQQDQIYQVIIIPQRHTINLLNMQIVSTFPALFLLFSFQKNLNALTHRQSKFPTCDSQR